MSVFAAHGRRSRSRSEIFWASVVGLLLGLLVQGCPGRSRITEKLETPAQMVAYVESGQYDREIAQIAGRARGWVEYRAKARGPGEQLVVVIDLDDTLFRNWAEIRAANFQYVPAIWEQWIHDAKAPAIEPVREVYRAARRGGVDVVLLTGRREREKADTLRNLQAIGCTDALAVIFMPDNFRGTTGDFKTQERKRLIEAGRVIIANIGDQVSDFAGGYYGQEFKLPNPFYTTP